MLHYKYIQLLKEFSREMASTSLRKDAREQWALSASQIMSLAKTSSNKDVREMLASQDLNNPGMSCIMQLRIH